MDSNLPFFSFFPSYFLPIPPFVFPVTFSPPNEEEEEEDFA